MSGANEETELKAGHPPAAKVGNMRITQKKSGHDKDNKCPVVATEESILKISTSPPKTTAVSGAPIHGHSDFTVEAVQSFHEKPSPAHANKAYTATKPVIHQPRK